MAVFEFDDAGSIAAIAARMTRESAALGVKAYGLARTYGVVLQNRVRANASGRPGPRAQTGDYRRSVGLNVGRQGASVAATAGTNRPQGRRLEFGFHGEDSLGRTFDQPALPHFGPALDKVSPEFERAVAELAAGVFDEGSVSGTERQRDAKGRFI